jgi:hypothetical protein
MIRLLVFVDGLLGPLRLRPAGHRHPALSVLTGLVLNPLPRSIPCIGGLNVLGAVVTDPTGQIGPDPRTWPIHFSDEGRTADD